LVAIRQARTALEAEIKRLTREVEGAEGKKAERDAEGDRRTDGEAERSHFKVLDDGEYEESVESDPGLSLGHR
jgi:hypothetical protein